MAKTLIHRYAGLRDIVLDPFCGSGTLLVEGAVEGRRCIGVDIDPVAVEVSRAKTAVPTTKKLIGALDRLQVELRNYEGLPDTYERLMHEDIDANERDALVRAEGLQIPNIPNMEHWFRNYVVVDLALILRTIDDIAAYDGDLHRFLRVVFASVIRNCSNADPVPVSGLEVTRHMIERDRVGRVINPYRQFREALNKAAKAAASFAAMRPTKSKVFVGDALRTGSVVRKADVVITSPPYHNAVDYYRRHQLEMFWLGLVADQDERLQLRPHYLGQHRVPLKSPMLDLLWEPGPTTRKLARRIASESEARARDFRAYCAGMQAFFESIAHILQPDGRAVLVVGNSAWGGSRLATDVLMQEAARRYFRAGETLWYPVKNRYMSYSRHNGASIDRELVVELIRD